LGSYESAEKAAEAFDRSTIHFRGIHNELNFSSSKYENDSFLEEHRNADAEEFFMALRKRFAVIPANRNHAVQCSRKSTELKKSRKSGKLGPKSPIKSKNSIVRHHEDTQTSPFSVLSNNVVTSNILENNKMDEPIMEDKDLKHIFDDEPALDIDMFPCLEGLGADELLPSCQDITLGMNWI